MKISDIKPDTIYTMTNDLRSIFIAGGCDPTCHCCNSKIPTGSEYKLGSVTADIIEQARKSSSYYPFSSKEPHEVMLCGKLNCTAETMAMRAVKNAAWASSTRTGGCSIINGVIVP